MTTIPTIPTFKAPARFKSPIWDALCGEAGAYVAGSLCGELVAIAEPLAGGWQFWLVRCEDGETLEEMRCAS